MLDTRSPETLFTTVFWPLYPPDVRADFNHARASDANPAGNPNLLAQLEQTATIFAAMAPTVFEEALELDGSDASVHRLGHALTLDQRTQWLGRSGPDGTPLLAHIVIHGAAYVGACVVRNHGGRWSLRRPLWDSLVTLRSAAGEGDLTVFAWWLKALSDPEIGRGTLASRYRSHVEVPCLDVSTWPQIVRDDRRLPRLQRPRYDTLYKYLRAHLPELRDLGADFPSPERFAELAFAWVDFVLVGDGRRVILYGPADHGVHVFWLGIAGFVTSAYYPADAMTEPCLLREGEKLRLQLSILGQPTEHEMLWWGP